jgi:hypothetical protein
MLLVAAFPSGLPARRLRAQAPPYLTRCRQNSTAAKWGGWKVYMKNLVSMRQHDVPHSLGAYEWALYTDNVVLSVSLFVIQLKSIITNARFMILLRFRAHDP